MAATVLVVDDHSPSLRVMQRVLEREGHLAVGADCIAAAENALTLIKPDLVVLDVQLSDGSGLELARRLRARPGLDACAILACTAGLIQSGSAEALSAGCDAFLPKPVDIQRFADTTNALLAQRPPAAQLEL